MIVNQKAAKRPTYRYDADARYREYRPRDRESTTIRGGEGGPYQGTCTALRTHTPFTCSCSLTNMNNNEEVPIYIPVVDHDDEVDGDTEANANDADANDADANADLPNAPLKAAAKQVDEDEVSIIRCDTSAGTFTMRLVRRWSPHGYDRAIELFRRKYYDFSHFYRVTEYLVQFGIGYTQSDELWELAHHAKISDDPKLDPPIPFEEGTIMFAGNGKKKNSRRSELFILYDNDEEIMKKFGNNTWETPIGKVVDGMSALRSLYRGYGELKPVNENGPDAFKIKHVGRSYVEDTFPLMDHFKRCHVEIEGKGPKHQHSNGAASVEDEMRYGRATLEMRKLSAAMTLAEGGVARSVAGRNGPIAAKKISAYRDHHDNVQALEGSGYSIAVALLLVCFLLYISYAISRINSKGARGMRSKAL